MQVPGAMPEAMAANANLFVSAENSQFGNLVSGPQVVEVVVVDSNINTLEIVLAFLLRWKKDTSKKILITL
jgi:hypothetical protein